MSQKLIYILGMLNSFYDSFFKDSHSKFFTTIQIRLLIGLIIKASNRDLKVLNSILDLITSKLSL